MAGPIDVDEEVSSQELEQYERDIEYMHIKSQTFVFQISQANDNGYLNKLATDWEDLLVELTQLATSSYVPETSQQSHDMLHMKFVNLQSITVGILQPPDSEDNAEPEDNDDDDDYEEVDPGAGPKQKRMRIS